MLVSISRLTEGPIAMWAMVRLPFQMNAINMSFEAIDTVHPVKRASAVRTLLVFAISVRIWDCLNTNKFEYSNLYL